MPLSESEFINIWAKENKYNDIFITIKQIDKDHNGYVTRTELDDILKLKMKESLSKYNLTPIINKFCSI